jgi:hypothetical protein
MHQLLRRAALALTLPLVVGAPAVFVAGPAHASPDSMTVTPSVEVSLYGQLVTATAAVFDGATPVTTGSVQFYVSKSGDEGQPFGARVPLNASGTATSPFLTQTNGAPFDITAISESLAIYAVYYDGADQPTMLDHTAFLEVTKSDSTIAVQPSASTLVADVTGLLPGGALDTSVRPDGGAVEFKVDGVVVGSNDAVNGQATINYVVPPGSHTITAKYSGDTHYLPSTGTISKTRKDPLLSATLLTTFPRSRSGWYRNAVMIWFSCRPQGSELTADCPGDVTLTKSGKGQSVTRSITALDGGSASITVGGINIDRDKPVIKVKGNTCTATDKLSGVKGKCHMTISSHGTYRAVAVDKAGNRAVKHGKIE